MDHRARGPFEVGLAPLDPYHQEPGAGLARFALDKRFRGELEAVSKGEMLSAGSPASSGGYVALEHVRGSLQGREGAFALMHNATMVRGTPEMNIIVVPGSGSGALKGLVGRLTITVAADGAHAYQFDYGFDPAI